MNVGYQTIPSDLSVSCDPRQASFFSDPYKEYARWHQQHPVFYWQEFGLWCVGSFSEVNRILRDRRFGRQILHRYSREELGLPEPKAHMQDFHQLERYSLLNLEAPEHTRLRKFVNHAFTHRRILSLKTSIRNMAEDLLDTMFAQHSPGTGANCDLLENYAAPLAAGVIAKLVGAPQGSIEDLLAWSHAMVRVYTLTQTREEEEAANQAAIEFREFLIELIAKRRKAPEEDLISYLVQAELGDSDATMNNKTGTQSPTDNEIVSVIVLLLNAGHEATVHQIGNAVRLLLLQDTSPASHFSDDTRTKNTVQELMRLDTPLHLFTRYALEPASIELTNGACLELKAGEEVALLLGAANHDPLVFDSPASFNPQRKTLDHVSLGAGTHFCVGALLAQQEIAVALETLFTRMPDLNFSETAEFADSFHFRGLKQLRVNW